MNQRARELRAKRDEVHRQMSLVGDQDHYYRAAFHGLLPADAYRALAAEHAELDRQYREEAGLPPVVIRVVGE